MFEVICFKVRTCPRTSKLRRRGGQSFGFAAFILVQETDKLPPMRLFLSGEFQNEILRSQIDRATHRDEFLVVIDSLVLSPDPTASNRDPVGAIVRRLQHGLAAVK